METAFAGCFHFPKRLYVPENKAKGVQEGWFCSAECARAFYGPNNRYNVASQSIGPQKRGFSDTDDAPAKAATRTPASAAAAGGADPSSSGEAGIHDLPEETLVNTLSTMTIRDLAMAARTSRQFARLVKDPEVIKGALRRSPIDQIYRYGLYVKSLEGDKGPMYLYIASVLHARAAHYLDFEKFVLSHANWTQILAEENMPMMAADAISSVSRRLGMEYLNAIVANTRGRDAKSFGAKVAQNVSADLISAFILEQIQVLDVMPFDLVPFHIIAVLGGLNRNLLASFSTYVETRRSIVEQWVEYNGEYGDRKSKKKYELRNAILQVLGPSTLEEYMNVSYQFDWAIDYTESYHVQSAMMDSIGLALTEYVNQTVFTRSDIDYWIDKMEDKIVNYTQERQNADDDDGDGDEEFNNYDSWIASARSLKETLVAYRDNPANATKMEAAQHNIPSSRT